MSQEVRKSVIGALALVMMGLAWAGGNKGVDTSKASGAEPNANGATAGASAGQGANGDGTGTGNGSDQSGPAGNSGPKVKDQALQRKQARAARHADIDKARQQALESLQAAFARRAAAEVAGSSEGVNEKVQEEKTASKATKEK